jgi:integrase
MSDLRIVKKRKRWVIQDYENNRKQVGISFEFEREAKPVLKKLQNNGLKAEVILGDKQYKFIPLFAEYAEMRVNRAKNPYTRETVAGVCGYVSYSKRQIPSHFPDVYLHQVDGKTLEQFVTKCNEAEVPFKTTKVIIQCIHTFLRWCLVEKYHYNFESALHWKVHKHPHLLPDDDDLLYEKEAEVITLEEANKILDYVYKHRERSRNDTLAFGVFTILAIFGLRMSELLGLSKLNIDFDKRLLRIRGMYDSTAGIYRNRTKCRGSKRTLDFTERQSKHIKWFYDYSVEVKPHNSYLFAALRSRGPISQYSLRKIIYRTYERVGLAKLEWSKSKNTERYKIIDCRFSGCPSKSWRHFNITMLIDNMHILGLTPNYIKSRAGHTRWQTTQDRYGNHNLPSSNSIRLERAEKVEKALGFNK